MHFNGIYMVSLLLIIFIVLDLSERILYIYFQWTDGINFPLLKIVRIRKIVVFSERNNLKMKISYYPINKCMGLNIHSNSANNCNTKKQFSGHLA